MAFDSLSEKLQNVFKNLRSKGKLTEDDVKAALKEVKMALLEADVNFKVVKQFTKSVQERAIGQDVMNGLNPGQMVIKIVNEEMIKLMGSETTEIAFRPGKELTVIMAYLDHFKDRAGDEAFTKPVVDRTQKFSDRHKLDPFEEEILRANEYSTGTEKEVMQKITVLMKAALYLGVTPLVFATQKVVASKLVGKPTEQFYDILNVKQPTPEQMAEFKQGEIWKDFCAHVKGLK